MLFPCITDGCPSLAIEGQTQCATCYDRVGFPVGWSRSRDDAWLAYVDCEGITAIPLPGGMDYEATLAALRAASRNGKTRNGS